MNVPKLLRESFALRTFAAIFVCISIVSAGLSAIYIQVQMRSRSEMIIDKGILLSNVLAHNVRVGVFSNSSSMIENPVKSVLGQTGVKKIDVWDYEGLCILSMGEGTLSSADGKPLCDEAADYKGYRECIDNKRNYSSTGDGELAFWAPVLVHRASKTMDSLFFGDREKKKIRVIGAVRVTMDRDILSVGVRELILHSCLLGLLALCCGAVIAYLQISGITKPLKRLKNDVYNFSIRGFRGRVFIDSDDEIGKLASTFNDMARVLENRERALEESHEALERKVRDRTAELRRINSMLNEEIVERLNIQKTLRESEKLYRGVFTSSTDAFFICDMNFSLLDVNPAGCKLYGYSKDEFMKKTLHEIFSPNTVSVLDTLIERINREGIYYAEVENMSADGSALDVQFWAVHYSIEDMERVLVTVRDISETRALQNQLLRSERLVATGQLAASVAHEINSPLQGITSYLSVMKQSCGNNGLMINDLNQVKEAFDSIKSIVKKLLDLNRPDEEKKAVELHKVIQNTVNLVRSYLMKHHVNVNFEPASTNFIVVGSAQQIGQCLMNLINNAVEAMGETDGVGLNGEGDDSRREIIIKTQANGTNAKCIITVEDTGPGIPEESLNCLFEPFYTRKKTKGMGIGLAVCQGIIEDHDGVIVADNTENGAVFKITLPQGI